MWGLCWLLVLSVVSPAQLHVEVRKSEVWLIRDGTASQLTHDRKAKIQAILSPAKDRIAYYEECPEAEHCMPMVVILDLNGSRLLSFQPTLQALPPPEPCASILSIVWAGENAVGAECHISPSSSEYVETDLSTRQVTRDLLGFDFVPSPDNTHVAHIGWMPHFSLPPFGSWYLQIDRTTVYPLPRGMRPVEQNNGSFPPKVVQQHGLTYSGIHQFASRLSWSPDSEHIAFIDCTYDWTANSYLARSAGDGTESNRHCSLAIVSDSGAVVRFPLTDISLSNDGSAMQVMWSGPRQIILRLKDATRTFNLP